MEKKINKLIYWTPRILAIIFLLFLFLFSFDVFGEEVDFWKTALAFFGHNIPVFVLTLVLWLSWKREIVGGLFFILAALAYIILNTREILRNPTETYTMIWWNFIVAGPALLIGILFIINWLQKKDIVKKDSVGNYLDKS